MGFSSFVLSNEIKGDVNIGVSVGEVEELSNYLQISHDIEMFRVCATGLVQNETIGYVGFVGVDFEMLNMAKFLTFFGNNGIVAFQISLYDEGTFGLLSNTFLENAPDVDLVIGSNAVSSSSALSNNLLFTSFSYDFTTCTTDAVQCSIRYNFDFSAYKDTFTTNVFDKIDASSFAFKFLVEVVNA